MKEQAFRAAAIIFFIGIIGTIGGLEHGILTWGRGLMQIIICLGGMVASHRTAEALRILNRRKRARK